MDFFMFDFIEELPIIAANKKANIKLNKTAPPNEVINWFKYGFAVENPDIVIGILLIMFNKDIEPKPININLNNFILKWPLLHLATDTAAAYKTKNTNEK